MYLLDHILYFLVNAIEVIVENSFLGIRGLEVVIYRKRVVLIVLFFCLDFVHVEVRFAEELGGFDSSASWIFIEPFLPVLVTVKSLAVCPQIQPDAISLIFEAGTKLSMFSLRLMEVRSLSIVIPFLSWTTFPKMSPDSQSKVSLLLAEPLMTLPTVVIILS